MTNAITLDYKTCNVRKKQEVFIKIPLSCMEVSRSNWMCKEMKFTDHDAPDLTYGTWLLEVKLTSSQKKVVIVDKRAKVVKMDNVSVFNNYRYDKVGVLSDYFTATIVGEVKKHQPSYTREVITTREELFELSIADFERIEIIACAEWLHKQPRDTCIEIVIRKVKA